MIYIKMWCRKYIKKNLLLTVQVDISRNSRDLHKFLQNLQLMFY